MENFDINFLSNKIKSNKRKIYENLYDINSLKSYQEKGKKSKKNKKEKFIQLFDDSDSLEEISPELCQNLEKEEEKKLLLSKDIHIIDGKMHINRANSLKLKRNSSRINIEIPNNNNHRRSLFIKKIKKNKSSKNLNEEISFINNQKILLHETKIIEEDEKKEEENIKNSGKYKSISKIENIENKLSKIKFEEKNLNIPLNFELQLRPSKSQEINFNNEKKSRLLDEIKNLSKAINVFIFDSDNYINISIYPSNTVKEIKTKIIRELKSQNYNLTTTSTDAYDLRVIDEDGESPDMDFPPLRDYVRVAGLKPQALAFLKNPNYINRSIREKSFDKTWIYQKQQNLMFGSFKERNSKFSVVPEEDDEDGSEKFEVKIFYKDFLEKTAIKSENIFLNPEDSLKNILDIFFKKDILKIKNVNLYYFVIHNNEEDLDSPFNLNINIKYLQPPYELDLCYKIFADQPKALNAFQISCNRKSIEDRLKQYSNKLTKMKNDNEEKIKKLRNSFYKK